MHLEKTMCIIEIILLYIDHENYIAGTFHKSSWYGVKLNNTERYQCYLQVVTMSHFLQHAKMITTFFFCVWMGTTSYSQGILEK